MTYLVDTNAWIGFLEGDPRFGKEAKRLMVERSEECVVSVASIWEAAIKVSLGKLKLPYDLRTELPDLLDQNGFETLGIAQTDALAVRDLERIHGDPFDRMMAVQALERGLRVISRDPMFDRYGLRRIW